MGFAAPQASTTMAAPPAMTTSPRYIQQAPVQAMAAPQCIQQAQALAPTSMMRGASFGTNMIKMPHAEKLPAPTEMSRPQLSAEPPSRTPRSSQTVPAVSSAAPTQSVGSKGGIRNAESG